MTASAGRRPDVPFHFGFGEQEDVRGAAPSRLAANGFLAFILISGWRENATERVSAR